MADELNEVNGEIYAVYNPNEEYLYKYDKEKNVKHTFINPDEMITDPDVDIIYIATPHISHYDYIKKALNAGKHVFAEKRSEERRVGKEWRNGWRHSPEKRQRTDTLVGI